MTTPLTPEELQEENASLRQQLSASEWIRKDNALRTYDGLTEQLEDAQKENAALQSRVSLLASEIEAIKEGHERYRELVRSDLAKTAWFQEAQRLKQQLAESRARVAELEEALGNILLSHDGRCVLICDDENPFGKWDCVEGCTDRSVRKARSRSEAKEKPCR